MFQIISLVVCLFLFAVSLSMFSKSAEQRARSRTELFYASQIREEADAIRLQNEKTILEITNMENKWETVDGIEDKNITTVVGRAQETVQEVVQVPMKVVELKELELDEKAIEFMNHFQPKQEEINLPEVTIYDKPAAWFNFPEVDLFMNERPGKGLYFVAGKVMDVLDDMSAIISDGTGERMLYHHKVSNLSVGDIIIAQVDIYKSVWNFVNVWEINESVQNEEKEAV